jgi:tetratricopeptide (TPR) repeat protein
MKCALTDHLPQGTIIRRDEKVAFQVAIKALERYVHRFQRRLKKKLQQVIDTNREVLTFALLPSLAKNPQSVCSEANWPNWASAEREFRRAIELNPNSAVSHARYPEILGTRERFDESVAEGERAQKLDPLSPLIPTQLG